MILIALGANLPSVAGSPCATLEAALRALAARGVEVLGRSPWYRTPAFPPGSGPEFVNGAAASGRTDFAGLPAGRASRCREIPGPEQGVTVGRAGVRPGPAGFRGQGSAGRGHGSRVDRSWRTGRRTRCAGGSDPAAPSAAGQGFRVDSAGGYRAGLGPSGAWQERGGDACRPASGGPAGIARL